MPLRLFSYILRSFVPAFLVIFTFLMALMMTFQLIKITNLLVSQSVDFSDITTMISQICVTLLPMTLPLSLLFAGVYSVNQLIKDSEYVAMNSFGISGHKIYLPIFIFTLALALWIYQLNQDIIPNSKRGISLTIRNLKSKSFISELKSGRFFTTLPGITLFAKEIDNETLELKKIFIEFIKEAQKRVISARTGKLIIDESDPAYTNLILDLNNGAIVSYNQSDSSRIDKILFDNYKFSFISKEQSLYINNKANTMNRAQLRNFLSLTPEQIKDRGASSEDTNRAWIEFHNRFNTPLLCLLFPFLGFCLGISSLRSRSRGTAFTTLLVLCVYYGLYFTFVGLAKKGEMNPALTVYLPLVFLAICLVYFSKRLKWTS